MRYSRIRASRTAILTTIFVITALMLSTVSSMIQRDDVAAQGVDWLSSDSVSYLTSSGITVMVPSWLPGPVSGTSPEIYAGGGSYSIYFYAGTSFLFITGVAGAGFPGGSEANLNVELSVNASVQGYPAIQDIGIPEGSDTPIYNKVMWIADGVFYTVSGNGLDSDSLSLANSSVALYAPAPAPAPTSPPEYVEQPTVTNDNTLPATNGDSSTTGTTSETAQNRSSATNTGDTGTTSSNSNTSDSGAANVESTEEIIANQSDGTGGPWFVGGELTGKPSDGTDGAIPPILGGDGTGGPP